MILLALLLPDFGLLPSHILRILWIVIVRARRVWEAATDGDVGTEELQTGEQL